ncbi:hypothetical protein HOK51_08220 [Candidatus Woesearchaeota archaeon]|jgi:hypothetical protein|nr:hypothetical protein [Candidatus Woesearchaeota archaeon]MBT6519810.1 hypothetical protein [Candidatus Woesearchaeota archaeon]MBT7368189.1 hypothetical protein [Candidatus Woesearchaeota archaeon]
MNVYKKSLDELRSFHLKAHNETKLESDPKLFLEKIVETYGEDNVMIRSLSSKSESKGSVNFDGSRTFNPDRPFNMFVSYKNSKNVLNGLWDCLEESDAYLIEFAVKRESTDVWNYVPEELQGAVNYFGSAIEKSNTEWRSGNWIKPSNTGFCEMYDDDGYKMYNIYFKWVDELKSIDKKIIDEKKLDN